MPWLLMPSLGSSWATLKISWLINDHSELHDISPTSNLVHILFYDESILTMLIFQNDILIFNRNLHYIHIFYPILHSFGHTLHQIYSWIYIMQLFTINQESLKNVQTLLWKDVEIIKVSNISSDVVKKKSLYNFIINNNSKKLNGLVVRWKVLWLFWYQNYT